MYYMCLSLFSDFISEIPFQYNLHFHYKASFEKYYCFLVFGLVPNGGTADKYLTTYTSYLIPSFIEMLSVYVVHSYTQVTLI